MLLRIFGYLFAAATFAFVALAIAGFVVIERYRKGLPDYEVLAKYEPPVTTRVHAVDGELMAEWAKERRLYLPVQAIPDLIKAAYLSAEDKSFFDHPGVDVRGVVRALVTKMRNPDGRMQGASTITQQVAKNFFLTNERTIERKIEEALLALRMEQTYSKNKILELYLNEIYLGMGSYGVAAAALNYFDKAVNELTLAEAAYLAALPKAPENYNPFRDPEAAISRRNWVISRMVENGYVTAEDGENASNEPLTVTPRPRGQFLFASEYFTEEVRRNIVERYGEDKLYGGGLSVRTSLDPELQREARRALHDGLIAFDRARGFRGPVTKIDIAGDWGKALGKVEGMSDVPEWQLAVVLDAGSKEATVGLQPERTVSGALSAERTTGVIPVSDLKWAKGRVRATSDVLSPGDVVYVEKTKDGEFGLRQKPEIEGALVAMDPYTGRVLALVGGFSFSQSEFNRATQAMRQPGSSFKPFVYAAALDNGYTPSSVVMDAPIEIESGNEIWRPQNYGRQFYGPSTLRLGIEKSRNVMTVRLAKDMGMPIVAEYAKRFGIYDDMLPVLSMSLGAGETTVLRLTTAYSVIANGGRQVKATLIDRIQDRYGRTIFKHDTRECEGCQASEWNQQDEPILIDRREQVLDPMTAFQITSMMEGVVQRGTATGVREVGKPIAGKTGTTNEEKDAWFVGFSPDLVVGVYVGYDTPRPMGKGSTGGQIAAPIFTAFMQKALADKPGKEFQVPEGLQLIPIDRRTGLQVAGGGNGVILEAFKPGTRPPSSYSVIGFQDDMGRPLSVSPDADRAIATGTGGLY